MCSARRGQKRGCRILRIELHMLIATMRVLCWGLNPGLLNSSECSYLLNHPSIPQPCYIFKDHISRYSQRVTTVAKQTTEFCGQRVGSMDSFFPHPRYDDEPPDRAEHRQL